MQNDNHHQDDQNTEDLHLQKTILTLLQEDPKTDASKMEVVVNSGEVLLKGKADTEEEKQHAGTIAASVPGVVKVENHLHIEIGLAHALSSLVAKIAAGDGDTKDVAKDDEQKH